MKRKNSPVLEENTNKQKKSEYHLNPPKKAKVKEIYSAELENNLSRQLPSSNHRKSRPLSTDEIHKQKFKEKFKEKHRERFLEEDIGPGSKLKSPSLTTLYSSKNSNTPSTTTNKTSTVTNTSKKYKSTITDDTTYKASTIEDGAIEDGTSEGGTSEDNFTTTENQIPGTSDVYQSFGATNAKIWKTPPLITINKPRDVTVYSSEDEIQQNRIAKVTEVVYGDLSMVPDFPDSPPHEPYVGDIYVKEIPTTSEDAIKF